MVPRAELLVIPGHRFAPVPFVKAAVNGRFVHPGNDPFVMPDHPSQILAGGAVVGSVPFCERREARAGLSRCGAGLEPVRGLKMKFAHETEKGSRSNPSIEFLLGPSVQFSPARRVHFDLVPLVGVTHDSPHVEAYAVLTVDLRQPGSSHYAPASLRSH